MGGGGGGGLRGRVEGGQAGCERRIEVFVKISKKNEELKFLCKFQKKKISSGGVGLRGRVEGGQAGCENFNKKKFWGEGGGGVGFNGGQAGCERRIEVFVKISKKNLGGGGGGGGEG